MGCVVQHHRVGRRDIPSLTLSVAGETATPRSSSSPMLIVCVVGFAAVTRVGRLGVSKPSIHPLVVVVDVGPAVAVRVKVCDPLAVKITLFGTPE